MLESIFNISLKINKWVQKINSSIKNISDVIIKTLFISLSENNNFKIDIVIAHKYIVGTEAMNIKEKRYHTKSVLPQKYSNSIAMPPSGNKRRGV